MASGNKPAAAFYQPLTRGGNPYQEWGQQLDQNQIYAGYENESVTCNMLEHSTLIHEGKKPFKCDLCDYSCDLLENMQQHNAYVHEGKNLFK